MKCYVTRQNLFSSNKWLHVEDKEGNVLFRNEWAVITIYFVKPKRVELLTRIVKQKKY